MDAKNIPENRPPASGMEGIPLFRIAGIGIRLDFTWFIVFLLLVWSLSAGYFPILYPAQTPGAYWLAGVAAALLFFASLLIHELAHSLVALREGMRISGITLFIFGGVANIAGEPPGPAAEIRIAAAGPLASFALSAIFWLISGVLPVRGTAEMLPGIFAYLAWINMALAVFNLFPGYPLDGGRILRAALWWKTGNIAHATKWASDMGKGFAIVLMGLGALQIFQGYLLGGIWLIFIGVFLRGIAAASYHQLLIRQAIEGVEVREVMLTEPRTVPLDANLNQIAHEHFLRYGYRGFPVAEGDRIVGVISISQFAGLSHEERESKRVSEAMQPMSAAIQIDPGAPLMEALCRMMETGQGRLIVMRAGGQMEGMITKTGLLRFLEIKKVMS